MPAGIVLAGGASRRMGTSKAWLDWHGTPLLRRVVGLLARGVDGGPVVVVRASGQALPPLPRGVTIAEDDVPGEGPLRGLLAGLRACPPDVGVAVACGVDAPLLPPALVRALAAAAAAEVDAAVPEADGRRHPLPAAYATALVPHVAAALDAGERSLTGFLRGRRVAVLDAAVHAPALRALNDPAALARARARLAPAVTLDGAPRRAWSLGELAARARLDGALVADPALPLADGDALASA